MNILKKRNWTFYLIEFVAFTVAFFLINWLCAGTSLRGCKPPESCSGRGAGRRLHGVPLHFRGVELFVKVLKHPFRLFASLFRCFREPFHRLFVVFSNAFPIFVAIP